MRSILLAEILRGDQVESTHFGAFVVADYDGKLVLSGGDPDRAIFPRSAIKALQALPLVISGAADRFGLDQASLALACASHVGSSVHVETAARMLAQAGRDAGCLECGTHWPLGSQESQALARAGGKPGPLHNNCSGKHAGFVCTCVATGREVQGYVAADHPTMLEVSACVSTVTGAHLGAQVPAVDGCSIPAYKIRLRDLAVGFARFGSGRQLPSEFADASGRLRAAVAANPTMLAGEGSFDTRVAASQGQRAFVKVGAEGVYCGALPEIGLGFALKCDDGAVRAAEAATASLLRYFLNAEPVLDQLAAPILRNWAGVSVGSIRPCLVQPRTAVFG